MDPVAIRDPRVNELKAYAEGIVKEVDDRLRIHDFRIVPGESHTNLIFDIAAPFEIAVADTDLRNRVADAIHEGNKHLFAVITVDRV
jgi:hypothetical protein